MDVICTLRKVLVKNRLTFPLLILFSTFLGYKLVQNPKFGIYIIVAIIFFLVLRFLKITIIKNRSYLPVIIFCLLLISPLIPTGLGLKKYTRLNEIYLVIATIALFMTNAVKGKPIGIKKTEHLLVILGLWMSISISFGYLFLDVIPSPRDFYQVFNIMLFVLYFRVGTFFNYKNEKLSSMLKILFIAILGLNIISISQIFPWGFKYILPLYVPEAGGYLERYQLYYSYTGTVSRTLGIITSPTSFSIILVIIIIMIVAWIVYMPARNRGHSLLINLLLILSLVTLILTFSRTGFIALIMSQLYFLIIAKSKDRRRISKIIIPYILVFALLITFLSCFDKLFDIPLSSLRGFRLSYLISGAGDQAYIIGGKAVSDIERRLILWGKGIQKGMMSPIFGWGPAHASNIKAEELGIVGSDRAFYGAHNEYIEVFMQTGLVGLVLLLSLFIGMFRKANRLLKENSDRFAVFVARSVQAIIVALVVFDLAVGFWFNAITPAILMIIFGVMYSLDKQQGEVYG